VSTEKNKPADTAATELRKEKVAEIVRGVSAVLLRDLGVSERRTNSDAPVPWNTNSRIDSHIVYWKAKIECDVPIGFPVFMSQLRHIDPGVCEEAGDYLKKSLKGLTGARLVKKLMALKSARSLKTRRRKREVVPCPECKSPNTYATSTTEMTQYRKCRKCGHPFDVARKKK
jgi:Zn ribbon nucleic-acid-binding protein